MQTICSRRTRRAIQLCVTPRQEYDQLPIRQRVRILRRVTIPQEMVRSHNTQAIREIRQRPVRQEHSAHPLAGAIPSLCSRQRAFLRMGIHRSHSNIAVLPCSPITRRNRPAESVRTVTPRIVSIPRPQHRLSAIKPIRLRVRPRDQMRNIQRSSVPLSTRSPHRTAAWKSR